MDIDMPKMNGFQASKQINELITQELKPSQLRNNICMHSAYLTGDSDTMLQDLSVKFKIAKPCSQKQIDKLLQDLQIIKPKSLMLLQPQLTVQQSIEE